MNKYHKRRRLSGIRNQPKVKDLPFIFTVADIGMTRFRVGGS